MTFTVLTAVQQTDSLKCIIWTSKKLFSSQMEIPFTFFIFKQFRSLCVECGYAAFYGFKSYSPILVHTPTDLRHMHHKMVNIDLHKPKFNICGEEEGAEEKNLINESDFFHFVILDMEMLEETNLSTGFYETYAEIDLRT